MLFKVKINGERRVKKWRWGDWMFVRKRMKSNVYFELYIKIKYGLKI